MQDALHLARLAHAQASAEALLANARREAIAAHTDVPDACAVEVTDDGLSVTYMRGGVPIGGEGV